MRGRKQTAVSAALRSEPAKGEGAAAPTFLRLERRAAKPNGIKRAYQLHRKIGVLISLPLIIIAFTGLLLNHTAPLGLDSAYLSNGIVLDWYGMMPEQAPIAVSADGRWITLFEESLYVDGDYIGSADAPPIGGGEVGGMLAIATEQAVYLLDPETKELIEKLGSESPPPGVITAPAASGGKLLLDTMAGTFAAPSDVSAFSEDPRERLPILSRGEPPANLAVEILQDWRGRGISYSRLVRDIHSGRIFSGFGALLADIAAVCLIGLILTGLYVWKKRSAR